MELGIRRRRQLRWAITAGVLLILLIVLIDDWGRDFISHEASIRVGSGDPSLQPLIVSEFSRDELVEGVRMAVRRIGNWEYVGEMTDEGVTVIAIVRTHRLLRFRDDITLRVEDLGDRRQLTGESRSRLAIGDLGRNPRNLRRLLSELQTVLAGSSRRPRRT